MVTPTIEELTGRLKEARSTSIAVVRELETVMRHAARRMRVEAKVLIPKFEDDEHDKLYLCIRDNSLSSNGYQWGLWIGPYEKRGHIRLSRNPDVWNTCYRYYKPQWYDPESRDVILSQLPKLIRVWRKNIDRELKLLGKVNRRTSTMVVHAKGIAEELCR